MTIWVDADSCPTRIREIVSKAARNYRIPAVFVSNRPVPFPRHELATAVVIDSGPAAPEAEGRRARGQGATNLETGDSGAGADADAYITSHVSRGDLVVTRDIPLAARLVERDVHVLNDRGMRFTRENVRERLSIRDFMYDLRQSTGYDEQRRSFGKREIHAFAAALDEALRKLSG